MPVLFLVSVKREGPKQRPCEIQQERKNLEPIL